MPMKPTDPLIAKSRGLASVAKNKYKNTPRASFVNDYIDAVYLLTEAEGMPDASIVIAQADVETGGFTSKWWRERGNPAGLGITGDEAENNASRTFKTGTEAARAHVAHLLLYATGKVDRGGLVPKDDPRYGAYTGLYGKTAQASNIQQLANKWDKAQPTYASIIADRGNGIFPNLSGGGGTTTPMATPQVLDYSAVGVPVKQKWAPASNRNRPGVIQTAKFVTLHETANTNVGAGALMHANFVYNGGGGEGVSFHFSVDDKEIYQQLPLNEASYNAGCGGCDGNYAAIAIELCVNKDANLTTARDNAARLVAVLLKGLGLPVTRLKKHQDWSGKWCPAIILSNGIWPAFVSSVTRYYDGSTQAPPIGKTYAVYDETGKAWDGTKNIVYNNVNFFADKRKVVTIVDANVRQFASPEANTTGEPRVTGSSVNVLGWVNGQEYEGEKRWWIVDDFSRMWVGTTTESPATELPPVDPAPGDGDGSDTVDIPNVPEIKIVNGVRFYPVTVAGTPRIVTLKEDASSRQWASDEAAVVQTFEKLEETHASYWIHGKEIEGENLYWVLTDDESRLWIGYTYEHPD